MPPGAVEHWATPVDTIRVCTAHWGWKDSSPFLLAAGPAPG
ncbi:MAG TPA: hypothetical protein VHF27_11085 [Acidimicrobiales bacterium]|nr:hypothetical protein [Acidimicrobiales bacterium]